MIDIQFLKKKIAARSVRSMIRLVRFGVVSVAASSLLFGVSSHAVPPVSGESCRSSAEMLKPMRRFAHQLLVEKDPDGAYHALAAADFVQRNPPFGTTQASTIAQWHTMTDRPLSRFRILSVRMRDDVADIRFLGQLGPGQTAEVSQHDKLRCGKIIEEWAELKILKNTPPSLAL